MVIRIERGMISEDTRRGKWFIFPLLWSHKFKDEQPSDKCVQKHLVRKINRSHWSEWLLTLKKKEEKLWILFDFLFDFKSNYISTVLIKCLLVDSLNAVAAVCNLKFSFHCTAFLTRLKNKILVNVAEVSHFSSSAHKTVLMKCVDFPGFGIWTTVN